MLKRVLGLLVVAVLVFSALAGCGASKSSDTAASNDYKSEAKAGAESNGNSGRSDGTSDEYADAGGAEVQSEPEKADAVSGRGQSTSSVSNAILSQRKIIRNANVSVEVKDFDKAYGQLKTLINDIGFVQESNIKKDKRYVDSKEIMVTSAVIVLRVDKVKFEQVIDGISGLGVLLDESIKSDDITDKFFDTEARLRLLKFEESRLEEYLKKLTDLDKIFKTERQLTDIRYEIEGLTGTLKKWNDLVELSTITVNMNEKDPVPATVDVKEKTYLTKLKDEFMGSFKGVISFCGDLILFLVGIFPVLVLLGFFGWIGYKIYRRFFRKLNKAINDNHNDNNISI